MYPQYFEEIQKQLIERDWVVHNNYLESEANYTLFLDTNIYNYIVNAIKKSENKKDYRDAIALIVFCQMLNIQIEPNLAIYEKINYNHSELKRDEIISDLNIFYSIDDTKSDILASYALGSSSDIPISDNNRISDSQKLWNDLIRYRRLKEWDSIYLMVLYIIVVYQEKLSQTEKLKKVINWMINKFRLSLVVIVYTIIFFSHKPMKKMMKYKADIDASEKRKSIYNMTWDLYNLNQYFRRWTENDSEKFLFATNDKASKEILRKAIYIQNYKDINPFYEFCPSDSIGFLEKILFSENSFESRVYMSEKWTPEYRKDLIEEYESMIY